MPLIKVGQFVLHAKARLGNPYDSHTLAEALAATETLTRREIERVYVDKGYVGHDAPKPIRVFRSGQKRGVHGQINVVMSAVGYNFRLILKWLKALLAEIVAAIWHAQITLSTLRAVS